MIAWGKDKSESRVTAEFYNCAVEVMRAAESQLTNTIALPRSEAFDIEYCCLKKRSSAPCPRREKRLGRQVVIVSGPAADGRKPRIVW